MNRIHVVVGYKMMTSYQDLYILIIIHGRNYVQKNTDLIRAQNR